MIAYLFAVMSSRDASDTPPNVTECKTSERVEHQRQRDDESEKQKAKQEAAKQVQKTVATESKSPKFNSTTPATKQR